MNLKSQILFIYRIGGSIYDARIKWYIYIYIYICKLEKNT
jgi:hypothetical protein